MPVEDGVAFVVEPEVGKLGEQLLDGDPKLDAGKVMSDAVVRSRCEGHVWLSFTMNVERIGIAAEDGLIAVRR